MTIWTEIVAKYCRDAQYFIYIILFFKALLLPSFLHMSLAFVKFDS